MKPQSRLVSPLCIQLSKYAHEDAESFSSSPEETNETGSGRFIQETSLCNGGLRKSQFKPKTMTERGNNTLANMTTQFSRPQSPANPQNTSIFINNSPLMNGNNNNLNLLSRQNTPIKKSNLPSPFFLSFSTGNIPQSVPSIGLNTPTNTAMTPNHSVYPIVSQKPNTRVLSVFSTPQSRGSTHTVESFGEEVDRVHSEFEQQTSRQQEQQQQQYIDPRYSHFIELIENINTNKDAGSQSTVDTETVADVLGDFRHFRILVKPQYRVDCARKLMKHLEIGRKQRGEFFFHRGEMCGEHQLVCVLSGRVAVYTVKSESDINQEMDLLGKIHQLTSQANKLEKENSSHLSEETQKTVHQLRQRCENATEELSKIVNRDEDELLRAYNPAKYFKTENISCFKREKYIDHGQTLGDEQIVNGGVPQTSAVALTEVVYFFIRSSVYRDIFSLEISKNSYVCQVLRNNFPGAKDDSLRRLSYDFKEEIYDYNKVIYEQNDPANLFMIVRSGEVEARKKIILPNPTDTNKLNVSQGQQSSSSPKQSQKGTVKDANSNYPSSSFQESAENNSPQLLVKKKGKHSLKEVCLGIIGEGQLLGIEDVYSVGKMRSFKAVSKTMDTVVYYITRKQLEDIIVLNDDYEMRKELRQQSKIKREYYDQRLDQLAKGAEVGSASFQESLVLQQQQQPQQGQTEIIKTLPFRSNRKQLSLNYAQFQQGDNTNSERQKSSNGKGGARMSHTEFRLNEMGIKKDLEQSEQKEDDMNMSSNNYVTMSSRSIAVPPLTDHEQLMASVPVELNTSDKNEFEKARKRLLKLRNLAAENKKNYRLKSQNSLLNSLLRKSTSLRIGLQSALSHKIEQDQENENNDKQTIIASSEEKEISNDKVADTTEKTDQEHESIAEKEQRLELEKIRSNREIALPETLSNAHKINKVDIIIGKNEKKRYLFDSNSRTTLKYLTSCPSEESPQPLPSQQQQKCADQDAQKQGLNLLQQEEQLSANVTAASGVINPSKSTASLADFDKLSNVLQPNFHNPFKFSSNNNQTLSVSANKSEKESLHISQSSTSAGASLLAIKITKNGFKTNPLSSYRSSLDNILPVSSSSSTYCLSNGFKSTRFTSRSSLAGINGLKSSNQTVTSIPQTNILMNSTSSPSSLPQINAESTSKRSSSSINLCGTIMLKHPTANACQSQVSSSAFFGERKPSWVDLVGPSPQDDSRLKILKTASSTSTARKTLNGFSTNSKQSSVTQQQQQQQQQPPQQLSSSSQVSQNPLKFILSEQLQKRQISSSTQTQRNTNANNNNSIPILEPTDSQKPGNFHINFSQKTAKRVVFTSERQQSLENTPNKEEIDYNQAPMMIQKKILFSK